MAVRFERLLRQMRSRDPQAAEDAFDRLRHHASDHVQDLIVAFHAERDDHGLRCWLLELIGEARSPAALPVLVDELNSGDEALRTWAIVGLRHLGTRPAREALWRVRSNGIPID